MVSESPSVKAWRTRKRKESAKKAVVKVKNKQWEPEKIAYLSKLGESSNPNACIVCGDTRSIVLQNHHADPKRKATVKLCANCHDIVRRGTLEDLKKAHNMSCHFI